MKLTLKSFLGELRSAGKNASRLEMADIFDAHLPAMMQAADSYSGISMSSPAKDRGLSALLETPLTLHESEHLSLRRSHRANLALAASILIFLALGVGLYLRWSDVGRHIASPITSPKETTPGLPQPKLPDLPQDENPIVRNGDDVSKPDDRNLGPKLPDDNSLAEKMVIGKFGRVQGEPTIRAGDSTAEEKVVPNSKVFAGAEISTGDGDLAEITLEDGSLLRLSFNTTIKAQGERKFLLKSGTIFAQVSKSPNGHQFVVETPAATARVLGTKFGLIVDDDNDRVRTTLQVKEGRVSFFNARGDVIATDMEMSSATIGSAPTEPKRLNSLALFGFSGTGQMLERRTRPLDEEAAATLYVYPLGWTGFMAGTDREGDLRIVTLDQNSSARTAGLRVGDKILSVDGQRPSMDELRRDMYQRAGQSVAFRIRRADAELEFIVPVVQRESWPTLPVDVAEPLFAATLPALNGDTTKSLALLDELCRQVTHAAVFNNLGVVYERLDRQGLALRSYQKAVELDGTAPLYRRALARVLLNIGNFRRSIEELEFALSLTGDLETLLVLSDTYGVAGKRDKALALIQDFERKFANSVELWVAKSSALMRADRLAESIEAAKTACQIAPDNASAYFYLGIGLNLTRKFEEAEIALARAIELDPCLATYYNSRAINLSDLGRHEDAEAVYREAVKLDPEFIPARIGLGGILIGSGRFKEAEEILRKTIELDPQNPGAHYDLAFALRWQGRLDEAEAMLRATIAIGVPHVDYYWEHAIVLGLLGRYEESLAAYERAVRTDPQNLHALNALAWCQIEMRHWSEAVNSLERVIQLDSTGHDGLGARKNLVFAYVMMGELERAERLISETIRHVSDDPELLSNYALLLAHKGLDLDKALEYAERAATPDGHAQFHHTLGIVHFRRAEYDAAVTALTKAIDGYGKVFLAADALFALGQVHEARNDVAAAISAYERAVTIDPTHKQAVEALQRIRK